jgi:hypothetical protein
MRRTIVRLALLASFAIAFSAACRSGKHKDPGALITVAMHGQVGVLLDEVPVSMRDRVATGLLAEQTPFWRDRAKTQVVLTEFRLAFRGGYYPGEPKQQLLLAPKEVWRLDFDAAGPKRVTVDGHDLVAIGYDFSTTIVSDADSPKDSEPALAKIGGTWDEPFVLPVDPEMVMQRTGYACINEAEFPPHSADAESLDVYYDQTCDVEAAPTNEGCHQQYPLPQVSCQDALTASIGKVTTTMHFERVPYSKAVADQFRVGVVTHPEGADLEPIGEDLNRNRVVYKYIADDNCAVVEGCVTGTGWRRLLRFDANLKNVGGKDLKIGQIDYFHQGDASQLIDHNVYEFSACHQHYHFKHYGDFDFDTYQRDIGKKSSFCLETTGRFFNNETTLTTSPYNCSFQGIAAGWGDEYGASLDCQWIDITDLDTKTADVAGTLTFHSNKDQFLCEGTPVRDAAGLLVFDPTLFTTSAGLPVDKPRCNFVQNADLNNIRSTSATIPRDGGGFVTSPCTRGQIGPNRDCGFGETANTTFCTVGTSTSISCAVQGNGAPQIVRVCERSAILGAGVACIQQDALANTIVTSSAGIVSFTCPSERDPAEPGGRYVVYSAPVFPGDPAAPVVCTP